VQLGENPLLFEDCLPDIAMDGFGEDFTLLPQ
jgi:hypothetical protein